MRMGIDLVNIGVFVYPISRVATGIIFLALINFGCGLEDGSSTSSEGPDTYVAGLEKTGTNGTFKVRLVESAPIPRDTGIYTWTLEVVDMGGNPITGAEVHAEPLMLAHGHGTQPKYTDGTVGAIPGQYILLEMDLFMPGVWHVIIRVENESGDTDELAYDFDLEG